jgi:8-oxo-dGTP pyrophosphatase MutT (NUDIX family)
MPINRAAATAVLCGDMILLGKRTESYKGTPVSYGGYWSLFGGSLEKGESLEECAARELLEEAVIKADPKSLKYVASFQEDNLEFIVYAHEVDDLLIPTLDLEHTEYGWFKIDYLKNFTEKIDPKIVECIEMYKEKTDDTANYFRKSPR